MMSLYFFVSVKMLYDFIISKCDLLHNQLYSILNKSFFVLEIKDYY